MRWRYSAPGVAAHRPPKASHPDAFHSDAFHEFGSRGQPRFQHVNRRPVNVAPAVEVHGKVLVERARSAAAPSKPWSKPWSKPQPALAALPIILIALAPSGSVSTGPTPS